MPDGPGSGGMPGRPGGHGPRPGRRGARRARTGRWAAIRARWRRQSPLAKTGYVSATVVAVLVLVLAIGAFAIYQELNGNITRVQVGGLSGRATAGVQNILVLGSQERLGQRPGHFGREVNPGTTNSDNLLLIHLDRSHTHATVLSIPRDLFVYEPACKKRSYIGVGTWPAQAYPPGAIIDGALNIGGPTCAVRTVEDLTGIKLDHFVEFDFNSFRTMVDKLGGVEVCVPPGPGYHDRYSGLNLSPGLHLLKYNQALAYVRTRHGVGSGSNAGGDLPRIQLQQAVIASLVQKIHTEGLLSNLPQLLSIAQTATRALTVDQSLGSVSALAGLAESLSHMRPRNVSLITLPTATDTYDYPVYDQHLMAVQPQDDVLYQMLRTGQVWHGHLPTQTHARVSVRVLNGSGQAALGATTAASLRALGYRVISVTDTAATASTTVQYAGLTQADGAYTLMSSLKGSPAAQNTLAEPAWQAGRPGPVTLILGSDFAGVAPPAAHAARHDRRRRHHTPASTPSPSGATSPAGPGASGTTVQSRNGGASICSGLPPAFRGGG